MPYISATAEIMYAPFDLRFVGIELLSVREKPRLSILHLYRAEPYKSGQDSKKLPSTYSVGHECFYTVPTLMLDLYQQRIGESFRRGLGHGDVGRRCRSNDFFPAAAFCKLVMQQLDQHGGVRRHVFSPYGFVY